MADSVVNNCCYRGAATIVILVWRRSWALFYWCTFALFQIIQNTCNFHWNKEKKIFFEVGVFKQGNVVKLM